MPVKNPCCCSLHTGTEFVGWFNVILTSVASILLIVSTSENVATIVSRGNQNDQGPDHDGVVKRLGFAFVSLIGLLLRLIQNIVLILGVRRRQYGKCRLWFIMSVIFLVIFTLTSLVEIVTIGVAQGFAVVSGGIFKILIVFPVEGYMMWVVHAFMEELKEGGPVTAVGYVHGTGVQPQAYIYTMQSDGYGNLLPSYFQTQEGYVYVPLKKSAFTRSARMPSNAYSQTYSCRAMTATRQPPSYYQTQESYVNVPMNPQGPGFPSPSAPEE